MQSIARRVFELGTYPAAAALSGILLVLTTITPLRSHADHSAKSKPTIVLVHGAFADSSSWNRVAIRLLYEGYPVVAASNPLRGVKDDADYVANLLDTIEGPVILVAHSYGGMVISAAAVGKRNVKALVYVNAFAPDSGESALTLSSKFPGSSLLDALAPPVPLSDGSSDLYIQQGKFLQVFAPDLPASEAKVLAATQRPGRDSGLSEIAGAPAWKTIPSFFLYGTMDQIIPPALHAFMAERAQARKNVVVTGASHVVMISHPDAVLRLIADATAATAAPR